MKYRVQWEESARDELANGWLNAGSELRKAITAAVARIDRELARDPYECSESRDEGRRVVIDAPVGVTFRVDDGDQVVYVLRCWCFSRKN